MRRHIRFWTILLIAAMIVSNCPEGMVLETFGSEETSEMLSSEETSVTPSSEKQSEENTDFSFADGEDQADNDLFIGDNVEMVIMEDGAAANPENETEPLVDPDPEAGFFVTQEDISKFSVALSKSQYTYNGKKRKPTVTVSNGDLLLEKGTDFTVAYKNNQEVGLATVVIKGIGAYKGKITKKFRINPKGTYLRSVKTGHQCISFTWKEQTVQTTGYQIRYSTDSGFRNEKIISVSADKTKKVLKNLKPGKRYYLQIRTYKKIDGKNFYSGWSSVKTEKLKLNTIIVEKKQRYMKIRMINPSSGLANVKASVFSKQNGSDDIKKVSLSRQSDGSYQANCSYGGLKHSGTCIVKCYNGSEYLNRMTVEITDGDIFLAKWLHGNDSNIDYAQCAVNIARDDSIGHGHTWPKSVSCAGLVGLTLTYCGYGDFIKDDPFGWGYIDLGTYSGYNWRSVMEKEVGAIWHSGTNGMKAGDIMYYDYGSDNNHTGIYLGNGLTVEARGPGGVTEKDDSGAEIGVYSDSWLLPWQGYYRIPTEKIHYRQ